MYCVSPTPIKLIYFTHFLSSKSPINLSLFYLPNKRSSSIPICRIGYKANSNLLFSSPSYIKYNKKRKNVDFKTQVKSSCRESLYEVLGVSLAATPTEIKKAGLQNSESRRKYGSGNRTSDYSYSTAGGNKRGKDEEEFYGLGKTNIPVEIFCYYFIEDFFKGIEEEYQNCEASDASQAKPKSLWEELVEIGEEFVEFLEKELNVNDADIQAGNYEGPQNNVNHGMKGTGSSTQNETIRGSSIEENIDDVEAALAQLKKELGL